MLDFSLSLTHVTVKLCISHLFVVRVGFSGVVIVDIYMFLV